MFSVLISSNIQNRLGARLSDCEKERRAEKRRGLRSSIKTAEQFLVRALYREVLNMQRPHNFCITDQSQDDVHWLQVTLPLYRKAKFKFSV